MEWDSGEYSCEVQNEAGTVRSEPATLTVHSEFLEANKSRFFEPEPDASCFRKLDRTLRPYAEGQFHRAAGRLRTG